MSAVIPLRITRGPLPLNYEDTPKILFRSMIRRAKAELSSLDVILGQRSGTEPTYDKGPWLNSNTSWFNFDYATGGYKGMPISFANHGYTLKAEAATLTADRTITFQDKGNSGSDIDERVALLLDVYAPRKTILPTLNVDTMFMNIDPYAFENYYLQLHGDLTIIFTAAVPNSKTITVGILNDGTDFTVTWPAGIKWPGGAPTQPIADTNGSGLGIYHIRNINGVLLGELLDSSPALPTMESVDTIPKTDYGGSGNTSGNAQNVNRTNKLP